MIRVKEPLFQEKFQGKTFTNEQWIDILVENPILMERPIVVQGRNAVIARPLENLFRLFDGSLE